MKDLLKEYKKVMKHYRKNYSLIMTRRPKDKVMMGEYYKENMDIREKRKKRP